MHASVHIQHSSSMVRYNKFDHKYMKKWLLREEPEEKHDIRLWQTFRNIDLQTAIKLHEEKPGAKAPPTPQIQPMDENHPFADQLPRHSSVTSVMYVGFSEKSLEGKDAYSF